MRITRWLSLACLGLSIGACSTDPSPLAPLPPYSAGAPTSITVLASAPTSANHILLTLTVLDAQGRPVGGQAVTLQASAGSIDPASVMTTTGGQAQAVLTSTSDSTVTATAGGARATTTISARAPDALIVSFTASRSTLTVGDSIFLSASASPANIVAYDWNFGDGGHTRTLTSAIAHTYGSPGILGASVTVTGDDGRSASATTTLTVQAAPVVPPTPPAPAPSLSLGITCTGNTHGTTLSPCNLTASYGGSALPSAQFMTVDWDWGDGFTSTTSVPVDARTYVNAGTYTVFAKATVQTVDGVKTSTINHSLVVP